MKKQRKKAKKIKREFHIDDLPTLFGYPELQDIRYELKPKNKSITLRLSNELLDDVKSAAAHEGLDYQKWIRISLQESLRKRNSLNR